MEAAIGAGLTLAWCAFCAFLGWAFGSGAARAVWSFVAG